MKIGEATYKMDNGEIRNAFPELWLNKELGIIVPTLLFVPEGSGLAEIMFRHYVEKRSKGGGVRILAECVKVGDYCGQRWLVDEDGKEATPYFVPKLGQELGSRSYMPSVHAHVFGLIGMGVGKAEGLYNEMVAEPTVGHVTSLKASV